MKEFTLPALTLVLGGAASGKSKYAEKLCVDSGLARIYVATSQAFDDEMHTKIFRHQAMRGDGWKTIEAPFDVLPAIADAASSDVVLIDCLTMWLTNHLLAEHPLHDRMAALLDGLTGARAPIIVVSNDVGGGIVPENELARRFRDAQGQLNQLVAERSDLVVALMAGLPLALKGKLPGDPA